MALIELAGFSTTTTQALTTGATSMYLDPAGAATLNAALGGSGHAYLLIFSPVGQELVRVTQGSNPLVTITRGQDGSTPTAFPAGSYVKYAIGPSAVEDLIAAGPGGLTDVTGAGIATVTTPVAGTRLVTVPAPNFTSSGDIDITGTWPNMVFDLSAGRAAETGTVTVVTGSTGVVITGDPNVSPNVSLSSVLGTGAGTSFGSYGSGGIIIGAQVNDQGRVTNVDVASLTNGSYSNASVTVANGRITSVSSGVGGGVTSVTAGNAKIVIGGSGSAPTVALAASGVTAGSYGGLTIDAFGTITAVAGGFNPISTISASPGNVVVTYPVSGNALITVPSSTTLAAGLVRQASTVEAVDFTNVTLALNPAGLKAAINSVGLLALPAQASASPLAQTALVDVAAAFSVSGTPALGLIIAHIRWDPATTAFDATLYMNGSPIQGSGGTATGGFRTLIAVVSNPTGAIEVRTTAPGGDTVSAQLAMIPFGAVP